MIDYTEEESLSDYDLDGKYQFCFNAIDPAYHNIAEERANGYWTINVVKLL